MTDSLGPKNFENSNVIESIAFGLATLEKHGDRSREIERLVQQISQVRNQVKGSLGELLWATENFLASVQTGASSDQEGLRRVLQDLAHFLHNASDGQDSSPVEIDEVDELLERLDFLASGGADLEVPRRDRSTPPPPTDLTRINFPIESSPLVEDPSLTSMLELGRSTGRLLNSSLGTSNDRQSQDLTERHLHQFSSIEARINEQSFVSLSKLVEQLTNKFKSDTAFQSDRARIEIDTDSTRNVGVYKSLASVLVPAARALINALTAATANRPEASFEFRTMTNYDELAFSFLLKGIKSKLAERMESTLRSLGSAESSKNGAQENSVEQDTASSMTIQSACLTFASAVQSVAGSLIFERHEQGEVEIKATVRKLTRIVKVFPVTIDSDRYGIEAYLIQAVVPTDTATCDIYRNLVVHKKDSYEYCAFGAARKLDQVSSTNSGLMVLMDCNDRKVALHVDEIHKIETLAVRQSSSNIEFGSSMSLPPNNLLQLDLQSNLSDTTLNSQSKGPTPQGRNSLYLCAISTTLVDRFNAASRGMDIECKVIPEFPEAIRAIQERRPRILVLQDLDNGTNWLEQVQLAKRHRDLSSTQLVIATTRDQSQLSRIESEFSGLKWISMDIQVSELVDLLASNLGSEG